MAGYRAPAIARSPTYSSRPAVFLIVIGSRTTFEIEPAGWSGWALR